MTNIRINTVPATISIPAKEVCGSSSFLLIFSRILRNLDFFIISPDFISFDKNYIIKTPQQAIYLLYKYVKICSRKFCFVFGSLRAAAP